MGKNEKEEIVVVDTKQNEHKNKKHKLCVGVIERSLLEMI